MKNKFYIIAAIFVFTGCTKKELPEDHPSSQPNEPEASMVACGDEQIAAGDAEQWDCIDDSHFLCLKDSGCKKGDITYPKWSFFGDNTKSFDAVIPKMPVNIKGYQLESSIYTYHEEDAYAWRCTNRDCQCGKGFVHGYSSHESCVNETFEGLPNRDCGEEQCVIPSNGICREGKCYCGNTWQGKSIANYQCDKLDGYMFIDDKDKCKQYPEYCEKYKYLNETYLICTSEDGCVCGEQPCIHNGTCMNDKCFCGETDITGFKDLDKYTCTPDNLYVNVMTCNDANGCLCGDHKIVKGAICHDNKQYCHNVVYDWLDEARVPQYICDDNHPRIICDRPDGCSCGATTCAEGAACINNQCVCGDSAEVDPKLRPNLMQYACIDGKYLCKTTTGCKCGEDLCISGVTCNADGCMCAGLVARYEKYSDFSCTYDYDYNMNGVFRCENEEGCKFDTSPDNTEENDPATPSDTAPDTTDSHSGDEASPNHDDSEEENHTFIKECEQGESCDADGDCYERDSYEYTYYGKTLYYNHQRIDVDNSDDKGGDLSCTDCDDFSFEVSEQEGSCHYTHASFICKKYGGCHSNGKLYKYNDELSKSDNSKSGATQCSSDGGCDCNGKRCAKGTYCQDGQCLCNHQPLYEGFDCVNDFPVCNGPNCKCDGELLKENYICLNNKQHCNAKSGCLCGDTYIAYNNICDHNTDICNPNGLSYHAGCKCGEQTLTDSYYCNIMHQMVCNQKDCACGKSTCHKGDLCDNGKCLCGETNNNGCLCGTEILQNNKQYVCIENNLVCQPDIVHDPNHYPPNSKTCSCGGKEISFGAICKNDQECTDCSHTPLAIIDKDGYYHLTCKKDDKSIDISYQYVAACYYDKDEDSDWNRMYYRCDDGNTYYELYDINPCDCLENGAPETEEGFKDQFCLITEYYTYECSDRIPKEVVDGWYLKSLTDDPTYGIDYCTDANSKTVPVNPNTKLCRCGNHEMHLDEVTNKSYVCDDYIAWRCIKDEGCTCGDIKCGKSQICIKPGLCSK